MEGMPVATAAPAVVAVQQQLGGVVVITNGVRVDNIVNRRAAARNASMVVMLLLRLRIRWLLLSLLSVQINPRDLALFTVSLALSLDLAHTHHEAHPLLCRLTLSAPDTAGAGVAIVFVTAHI